MRASSGVLGATATITLLSGLLVGLAPAFTACRSNLNQTLRASGYGIAGPGSQSWLRQALVVGQVAAAMVLLLGMGLCVRSFAAAQDMDLGFQPRGLWLAGFRINPHQGDDTSVRAFYRRLQSETCRLPGVESAALSSYLPLGLEGIDRSSVSIPGYVPAPGENPTSGRSVVSPGYFHTLQIPMVAGREFSDADSAGTPFVAVVNEAFVAKYFPGRDPLGLTFSLERGSARVIGVVKTGKYESLKETASPHFFLSTTQQAERNVTLAVRTHGPPSAIGRSVANLAVSLDPSAPPHAAMLCEDYVRSAFTVSRVAASLMSALGLAALLLAVLGLYAILSQQVNARIPELGVRAALGARPIDAVWLVVSRGLRLATIGIVIGALGGWGVCRLLSALLVGTTAGDLAAWVLAPTLLLCAVLAACWLPARRAANINPMEALRYE
jgi:predicted permease